MAHNVTVRQEIVDRVLKRRGRYHFWESFQADKSALVVIDMQDTFCRPGAPGEVAKSREIVPNINTLARQCRNRGAAVIWVVHANARLPNGRSDWQLFSDMIVHGDVRERTLEANSPGNQKLWEGLEQDHDRDITCIKNRYSALVPGSSSLERILRSLDIDTLFVAGTKTNVCCESTARDAMMLDFKVVLVEDCCAALSDEEHRATLENMIQQFGDVMRAEEVISRLT